MNIRRFPLRPYILLFLVLVGLCATVGVASEGYHEVQQAFIRWETARKLEESTQYYDRAMTKLIPQKEHLLAQQVAPLQILEAHPRCIVGVDYRLYGSEKDYEAIVANYANRAVAMGWEEASAPEFEGYYAYCNRETDFTMCIGVFVLSESLLQSESIVANLTEEGLAQWREDYQTVYGIKLIYAQPETACLIWFGLW